MLNQPCQRLFPLLAQGGHWAEMTDRCPDGAHLPKRNYLPRTSRFYNNVTLVRCQSPGWRVRWGECSGRPLQCAIPVMQTRQSFARHSGLNLRGGGGGEVICMKMKKQWLLSVIKTREGENKRSKREGLPLIFRRPSVLQREPQINLGGQPN